MGFVENLKGMFVSVDEEYDDMGDYQQHHQQETRAVQPTIQPKPMVNQYYEEEVAMSMPQTRQTNNKIMSVPQSPSQVGKMIIIKPSKFEQATDIAAGIKARRTVFVNLEDAPLDVSRRLLDFLGGAAYVMDGKIERVSNLTYIFAPHDAELIHDGSNGDGMDELETPGIYY